MLCFRDSASPRRRPCGASHLPLSPFRVVDNQLVGATRNVILIVKLMYMSCVSQGRVEAASKLF